MTEEEKNSRDRIQKLVKDACTIIAEHVDTVQIMITFKSEDAESTASYEHGRGNIYARIGQANEWILMQSEYSKCEARRRDKE